MSDNRNALTHWWQMLLALPWRKNSRAYERLKRVWWDQTGTRNWYFSEGSEGHRVVSVFENFVLFNVGWVEAFLEAAGLDDFSRNASACQWSYEFEDAATKRICDVVLHGKDSVGEFIVVVEAKKPRGKLKDSDNDPAGSLELAPFASFTRRAFVFLLDERDVTHASKLSRGGRTMAACHGNGSQASSLIW